MAGSDLSGIGLSASESRGFTASPVDRGVHSEGSMYSSGSSSSVPSGLSCLCNEFPVDKFIIPSLRGKLADFVVSILLCCLILKFGGIGFKNCLICPFTDTYPCKLDCKLTCTSPGLSHFLVWKFDQRDTVGRSKNGGTSNEAERGKAQTGESSNFMNVLKERVRAVIDAPHSSSPSISTVGSISHPTTTDVGSHRRAYAPSSDRPELQMLPLESAHGSVAMESDSGRTVRSAKLEDYYSIDWVPKELILKFRQQVEGFQVGANFEFERLQAKDYNTKLVFKPLRVDRKWKFICEPKYGDLRLLTKKISLGPLLNIQIGIGHDWHSHTTGWKWKVTSAFGGSGHTQMRHKSLFAVTPGFDVRVGWNAEYILPDLHGAVGTGDPTIGLNLGHLYASIERLEAIYTHMT